MSIKKINLLDSVENTPFKNTNLTIRKSNIVANNSFKTKMSPKQSIFVGKKISPKQSIFVGKKMSPKQSSLRRRKMSPKQPVRVGKRMSPKQYSTGGGEIYPKQSVSVGKRMSPKQLITRERTKSNIVANNSCERTKSPIKSITSKRQISPKQYVSVGRTKSPTSKRQISPKQSVSVGRTKSPKQSVLNEKKISPKYSNNKRKPSITSYFNQSRTKKSVKNKKIVLEKKGVITCKNTPNYLINDIYLLLMDECISITKNN